MSKTYNIVAFDCGNSSIRVVLGTYNGKKIETKVIHQVENYETELNGVYYWDIMYIFRQLKLGLKKAYHVSGNIDSVGICTWGIDYGLLSSQNELLSNPLCYRNDFGSSSLKGISEEDREFIFNQTGIQCDKINTLYQILGYKNHNPEVFNASKEVLLIGDLLLYLFTGEKSTESSIMSTTQVYNAKTLDYSNEILEKFNLSRDSFMEIVDHGKLRGIIRNEIVDELQINSFPFISVASHDTASAVAAVPSSEDDFIFISSGTWSLVGTELEGPIINNDVYKKGFSNEVGAYNKTTFLKNLPGLFIAQRLKRDIEKDGYVYSWDKIVEVAKSAEEFILIDTSDEKFFNPRSMRDAINEEAIKTIGHALEYPALLRTVYESLAFSYKRAIEDIESITGKKYSSIYIVGGGSQNHFLNKITSDLTSKHVFAGPIEATSLGNIGVQLSYFEENINLNSIREIIKASVEITKYSIKQVTV